MIIIGYQGIGKSTLAQEKQGYIDLESGCFWYNGERPEDWYIYYCQIAEHLSKQGYVVFVSSHEVVRKYLKGSSECVFVLYPAIIRDIEWKQKLRDRYESSGLEKDYKAWQNAEDRYHENISELMMSGFPLLEIDHMNYDLDEMIRNAIENRPDLFPQHTISKLIDTTEEERQTASKLTNVTEEEMIEFMHPEF